MREYRVVEVGTEEHTYFKVQERGWIFWKTWRHYVAGGKGPDSPIITATTWFNTKEEAKAAIDKDIENSKPKEKVNRIATKVVYNPQTNITYVIE